MELFINQLYENPAYYVSMVAAFAGSICIHEYSHASVANHLGDSTARDRGFLTVNPLKVMGWMSIAALLLFGFSWGAVPVRREGISAPRRSAISLAGPLSNLALLGLAALLLKGVFVWNPAGGPPWIRMFLACVIYANAVLFLLNILPVPGLDGWGTIEPFLPAALVPSDKTRGQIMAAFFYIVCISGAAGGLFGKAIDAVTAHFLPSEISAHSLVADGNALFEAGDYAGAFKAFEEAAGQGSLEGKLYYGFCLMQGIGCQAEPEKAFAVLSDQILVKTFPLARLCVAGSLLDGIGCERDERRAFELLDDDELLEASPRAKTLLGFCLYAGLGTPQDFARAARLLEAAAEAGEEDAVAFLGWENGQKPDYGMPLEEWLARKWAATH